MCQSELPELRYSIINFGKLLMALLIINRLQMFIKIKLSVHKKLRSTPEQSPEPAETNTF